MTVYDHTPDKDLSSLSPLGLPPNKLLQNPKYPSRIALGGLFVFKSGGESGIGTHDTLQVYQFSRLSPFILTKII
jgi:hypothetical protein